LISLSQTIKPQSSTKEQGLRAHSLETSLPEQNSDSQQGP